MTVRRLGKTAFLSESRPVTVCALCVHTSAVLSTTLRAWLAAALYCLVMLAMCIPFILLEWASLTIIRDLQTIVNRGCRGTGSDGPKWEIAHQL